MNTLKTPPRLLSLLVPFTLACTLGFGLAGCSSTSGTRTGAGSKKMKTFLSVGDKPLPVVTGDAGSVVSADAEPAPAPRRGRPAGRISGRVFDADGKPVPDARVRLAVSGAAGGKVVRASTDRSGAFTLHGLRPGSNYTVIAEWEGDEGKVSGRANARTSDTDVRISLGEPDPTSARAEPPSRVKNVSDRASDEPGDEDEQASTPARVRSNVNEEDLPPATEAEALAPNPGVTSGSRASASYRRDRPPTAQAYVWRKGTGERVAGGTEDPSAGQPAGRIGSANPAAPVDPEARGTAAPAPDAVSPLDDVPNPLPPALERAEDQASASPSGRSRSSPGALTDDPDPFAKQPPRLAAKPPSRTRLTDQTTRTRPPAASSAFESPSSPTEPPAAAAPTDSRPGALVVVPETFAPVVVHESDPFAAPDSHPGDPFTPEKAAAPPTALGPAPVPARRTPDGTAFRTRQSPSPLTTAPAAKPRATATAADRKNRPTWGDVAMSGRSLPPLEGQRETVNAPSPRGEIVARSGGRPAPQRVEAEPPTDPLKPECEYDDRHRRIVDFRLPSLDGKPLRFQEIDADLVLIDFWGTWCQPCLQAVPHLVELQERVGNKRLAVVGVACEQDAPGQAASRVAATAERLKINYPILLSRTDGSCPLQEALHVQAFPTMVLVDRQGRVLWRGQGATPATLARLDRFIATSPKDGETRRY